MTFKKDNMPLLIARSLLVVLSFTHLIVLCLTKPYNYWGNRGNDHTGVFALGSKNTVIQVQPDGILTTCSYHVDPNIGYMCPRCPHQG